jgi:hypothetical protein
MYKSNTINSKKCPPSKCTCDTPNCCINPYIYFFKSVFALTKDNAYTLLEALEFRLNQGFALASNPNLCCPDCEDGPHILASAETYLKYAEAVGSAETCCVNYFGTNRLISENYTNCCESDFTDAVSLWIDTAAPLGNQEDLTLTGIIERGIIEVSTFSNCSSLGILFRYLQSKHRTITSKDYTDILAFLLDRGVVTFCDGCAIYMLTVEDYLKYREAVGERPPKSRF